MGINQLTKPIKGKSFRSGYPTKEYPSIFGVIRMTYEKSAE